MKLGIEVLAESSHLLKELKAKNFSLLSHDSAVDSRLRSSLEVFCKHLNMKPVSAFGPQHGFVADKQDNMVESEDEKHFEFGVPIHSLYSETRKPRDKDVQDFDVILVDLQDIGCRIYTYVTTLFYMMEACERHSKQMWVLDRPNPAGRGIEGFLLSDAFMSFVGAKAGMGFQHGMSIGELAGYFSKTSFPGLDLKVVKMDDFDPELSWPLDLPWVNPSPNVPRHSTTTVFPGSVLLEGSNLSEGRGTTRPLELWGHPEVNPYDVVKKMTEKRESWMNGCVLRPCSFEPTFHKFAGQTCRGFQVHVDCAHVPTKEFRAFRLFALLFKVLRENYPESFSWRQPPYEYEHDRLAIDLLSGDDFLRSWVDDKQAEPEDLESRLQEHERKWESERRSHLLYE